jgi:hypothetical protein
MATSTSKTKAPAKAPAKSASSKTAATPAKAVKAAAPKIATTKPAPAKTAAPKTTAAKPAAKPAAVKPKMDTKTSKAVTVRSAVTPDQRNFYIEVAAYYIAERRGFHGGCELSDWTQAEKEIDELLASGRINP